MELVFLLSADSDIRAAFEYYEDKWEGLGEEFVRHVELGLKQIKHFPQSGTSIKGKHRRVLIQKFPYGIFYSLYPNRIVVSGVMNLTQDPDDIQKRLNG